MQKSVVGNPTLINAQKGNKRTKD